MASHPAPEDRISSDRAQLSALSSTLDDLTDRITGIAGTYQGTSRDDVSHRLYEVERALMSASRQLAKAMRQLD